MKKTQIILIIIGVFILIGLVSGFSYWLGQKSVEMKLEITAPNPLESKVIRNWSATALGEVIEISDRNITLNKEGETLVIPIIKEIRIQLITFENQEKKIKEINFGDIEVGDEVSVEIGVNLEGGIVGNSITVLSKE